MTVIGCGSLNTHVDSHGVDPHGVDPSNVSGGSQQVHGENYERVDPK